MYLMACTDSTVCLFLSYPHARYCILYHVMHTNNSLMTAKSWTYTFTSTSIVSRCHSGWKL